MVKSKNVGKFQVKVVSGTNYVILTDSDREMDKRASKAVNNAIQAAEKQNKPVAKYDPELKKAYLLDSNGIKQYAD